MNYKETLLQKDAKKWEIILQNSWGDWYYPGCQCGIGNCYYSKGVIEKCNNRHFNKKPLYINKTKSTQLKLF